MLSFSVRVAFSFMFFILLWFVNFVFCMDRSHCHHRIAIYSKSLCGVIRYLSVVRAEAHQSERYDGSEQIVCYVRVSDRALP